MENDNMSFYIKDVKDGNSVVEMYLLCMTSMSQLHVKDFPWTQDTVAEIAAVGEKLKEDFRKTVDNTNAMASRAIFILAQDPHNQCNRLIVKLCMEMHKQQHLMTENISSLNTLIIQLTWDTTDSSLTAEQVLTKLPETINKTCDQLRQVENIINSISSIVNGGAYESLCKGEDSQNEKDATAGNNPSFTTCSSSSSGGTANIIRTVIREELANHLKEEAKERAEIFELKRKILKEKNKISKSKTKSEMAKLKAEEEEIDMRSNTLMIKASQFGIKMPSYLSLDCGVCDKNATTEEAGPETTTRKQSEPTTAFKCDPNTVQQTETETATTPEVDRLNHSC